MGDDQSTADERAGVGLDSHSHGYHTEAAGRKIATVRPDLKFLNLRLDPAERTSLFRFFVLGFREELMHGERHRFTLTRNIRVLRREAYAAVLATIAGDRSATAAAADINRCWQTATAIEETQRTYLETVDKFLAHTIAEDRGYIKQRADELTDDPLEAADFVATVEQSYDAATESVPNRAIYDRLTTLRANHSLQAALAAADAALDVPGIIMPSDIDIEGLTPQINRSVADVNLERRFNQAAATVPDMMSATTGDISPEAVADELADAGSVLTHHSLPLLDHAPAATDEAPPLDSLDEGDALAGPMARVLLLAFSGAGSFGGAAYIPTPEATSTEWLLNPFVRERPVENPYLSDPTTQSHQGRAPVSYGQYWTLNMVLDGYMNQLMAAVDRDSTPSVECTLCHSADHSCGPTGCAFEALIDRLDANHASMVAAIQTHR